MRSKLSATAVTVALGAAFASQALAQAKPDLLVKQRKAAMTLQAKYIGPIGGMLKGNIPYNADIVARNAAYLEVITKLAWDGFDPVTKDEKDTKAKPQIYSEPEKFKAAYETLQAEVAKLATAAKAKDEAGVRATFGGVAKACGSCHDAYQAK